LMSILRRKKPDPAAKVRKVDLLESAARRDTPLERSRSDLLAVRSEPGAHAPRLQKRHTMGRENSESWPLPATNGNGVRIGEGSDVGDSGTVVAKKKKFQALRKMFRLDD